MNLKTFSSAAVPYIAPQQQAYTQPTVTGGNHPYSLKAPYAAATPQVQQVAAVPQVGALPQQNSYITPSTAVYNTVPTAMPQQMVGIPQQQPAPVAMPYATTVQQQQQSAIGVQSSAPMTTQQYLQTVGLQQAQQQAPALGITQNHQQTTLSAPYGGVSVSTQWMQQQQQPAQQQMMSLQRPQSVVPQQQSYQSGLVKLNLI
ncbi:hypothetical protein NECAME_12216 [Necator americanus]|uniref:Uncharacterized protein n=1 Tax=Necator americanus TaxID=51031 RepID=W2T184_NECAM|nr:hypothetical protein NECAME_12216 [Necator americanus]ETN75668.1 hypothetical protein NECAME_12216 [Necator americanus]